jgi:hypothetical protein
MMAGAAVGESPGHPNPRYKIKIKLEESDEEARVGRARNMIKGEECRKAQVEHEQQPYQSEQILQLHIPETDYFLNQILAWN